MPNTSQYLTSNEVEKWEVTLNNFETLFFYITLTEAAVTPPSPRGEMNDMLKSLTAWLGKGRIGNSPVSRTNSGPGSIKGYDLFRALRTKAQARSMEVLSASTFPT